MRPNRRVVAGIGAVLALSLSALEPASAESFLQRLFGWGDSTGSTSRAPEPRSDPPPYNFGYGGGYQQLDDRRPADPGWKEDTSTYRTLCVRTCDGFYFPISYNVRRERLYADARTCAARCDGEARLYYYPTKGGSAETMVDLGGRPYAQMQNAFLYRKTLVNGCSCKPAPWSAEAAARHQGYAVAEREVTQQQGEQRVAGRAATGSDGIEAYLMRESEGPPQSPWTGSIRR